MKKLCSIIMTLVLAGALAGCAGSTATAPAKATPAAEATQAAPAQTTDDTTYKIGVLQYVQHAALDASNKGFFAALDASGIKYVADQQNASGDQPSCQTIAESLVNNGNDLILAIATPAAQAVVGATTEIPVIITAVTDPAGSGLVASNDAPGGNVTGTSDLTPVKEQIDLLKKVLPKAETVGILYCTAESNSEIQATMAQEACKNAGLESKVYTVSSSNEIQQVVESMVGNVDCIYAPTDNTIAAGMTTVAMVANENNLPIICGEEGMVNNGGLCTYGIDYYELGYLAGQQAVAILKGEATPAETPIGYLSVEKCALTVNEEVAKTLGIDVSKIK